MQLTNIVVVIVLESKWAIKFVDFESSRRRGKTTKSDCNKSAASATERVGCCRARNDKIINERVCVVADNEIIKANRRENSYHNKFLAFSSRIHELIRQLSPNHFSGSLSHIRVAPRRQMLEIIFRSAMEPNGILSPHTNVLNYWNYLRSNHLLERERGFRHLWDGNCKATQMEMNQFPARVNIRKVKPLRSYHLQSIDKLPQPRFEPSTVFMWCN